MNIFVLVYTILVNTRKRLKKYTDFITNTTFKFIEIITNAVILFKKNANIQVTD